MIQNYGKGNARCLRRWILVLVQPQSTNTLKYTEHNLTFEMRSVKNYNCYIFDNLRTTLHNSVPDCLLSHHRDKVTQKEIFSQVLENSILQGRNVN